MTMPTEPTYTFDPGLPTDTDWVRSILQDNGQMQTYPEGDWVLSDQEITAYINANGWNDGIATAALAMVSNYGQRETLYKAGSTDAEFVWKDRVEALTAIAALARKGGIPDPTSPERVVSTPEMTPYVGRRRVRATLLGPGGGGCNFTPRRWPN
jgi:hypothetical protein